MNNDNGKNGSVTETVTVIESVGTYLPAEDVSTRTVLDGCRKHLLVPLERWSGIKTRRMAGTTEFSVDLAERAISRCLEKSSYAASDVELLICCNISKQDEPHRFSLEPTTSATLLTKFGFGDIAHFDLSNACAGTFTGIYIADSLIRQGVFKRVLVVSGEYITHLTRTAQIEIESSRDSRLACLTLGDAAAAVMLEASTRPGVGFQRVELRTAPEYSDLCIAKSTDKPHGGAIMFTDSTGLNDHATESSVLHALATLQDCEVQPEQIDHWILHQTSQRALRGGAAAFNRALGRTAMTQKNTVDNLSRRGNTATTSHFVALADLIEDDRIRSGQNLLFAVQASGITYGTAVYHLDDLPARLRNGKNGKNGKMKPSNRPQPASDPPTPSLPTFQRLGRRVRVESAAALLSAQPGESEIQMASRAALDCLARSEYSARQIDVLIFAGVYRNEFLTEPAVATLVAKELGIVGSMNEGSSGFFAFDILNGGLGSLTATWVASNLIAGGQAKVVLVIAAECIQQQEQSAALGIVDAASAMVLDAGDGTSGFDSFSFASAPHHHDVFRTYADTSGPAKLGLSGVPEEARRMAVPEMRRVMDRHLEATGLARESVAAVLASQGSDEFMALLAEGLDLPAAKLVNAGKGNVFASSLAFTLLSAPLSDSEPLVALEFATGLQVGCATYYGGIGG